MKRFILLALLALASPVSAAGYDPRPWLADLDQARRAIEEKYANRDWLVRDRGFDLDAAFGRARDRLNSAASDAEARRILERLFERFRDGHVSVSWPAPPRAAASEGAPQPLCQRLGYNASYARAGTTAHLSGWTPLPGANAFPAGIFSTGGRKIGAIRIAVFMPQAMPSLCEAAARALKLAPGAPCDDRCADQILTLAYRRMTADLGERLQALRAAGAEALLIDIGDNGGGSEWAEAAARMVTAKPIVSAARYHMRGPHWARILRAWEADFRTAARTANGAERTQLMVWADQAGAAATAAERDCAKDCERLARAGFATGMVGSARPGAFAGKPWATTAFSIAQHAYREGAWDGPLIVLVDQETWSAAEEFAAVLQDNEAAAIIGARTGGAGCGHTNGGTPTVLDNSKGVLSLPDCARLRRDGSNEVNGIVPDVVVGLRHDDGPAFKARLIEAKLPEALARAEALMGR
jgi:hypothetical protein